MQLQGSVQQIFIRLFKIGKTTAGSAELGQCCSVGKPVSFLLSRLGALLYYSLIPTII